MKRLKIKVSKAPDPDGEVAVKTVPIKKKLLEKLFGTSNQMTIIVPGNRIQGIVIQEVPEGGESSAT